MDKYTAFHPGQVWLDTNGKRIQANGGSVYHENGVYYFYGENKEYTDGIEDVITWGVRCYTSRDLYNWEDIGLIIPPDLEDRNSPLHPSSKAERPHIIHNKMTGKYVCFMKVIMRDGTQRTTILSADKFTGPYSIVKHGLLPLGGSAGDFDLQVDEATGKAYYIFERVHTHTVIAELTDDYLDFSGKYSEHFKNGYPPHVREAAAYFIRNGKHYLLTSGTTGYYPNPSELSVADDWHGPYKILGNPHPDDKSNTSFHSQVSSVFKVEGKKDLYIACADRWLPEAAFLPYEEYAGLYEKAYNPASTEKPDWTPCLSNILSCIRARPTPPLRIMSGCRSGLRVIWDTSTGTMNGRWMITNDSNHTSDFIPTIAKNDTGDTGMHIACVFFCTVLIIRLYYS